MWSLSDILEISLIYIRKSIGPSILPCGTPRYTGLIGDNVLLKTVRVYISKMCEGSCVKFNHKN